MKIGRPFAVILLFFFSSCLTQKHTVRFSKIKSESDKDYNREFAAYCKLDSSKDFEKMAVLSNFFGDHVKSIDYATKSESPWRAEISFVQTGEQEALVRKLKDAINDRTLNAEEKQKARQMLDLLIPKEINEVFQGKITKNANELVVENAGKYNFVLINEAHYNAQNRAFTTGLLKPLWDKGFRYLALEALASNDSTLLKNGYPLITTGYYFRDPVLGNMVREALAIGYKIIPYETADGQHGPTLRDRDQALNIYNSTRKVGSAGKVLIHAGYSHISESGGEGYLPMGSQLKALAAEDILTIDQVRMAELNDPLKNHPYYEHVLEQFSFKSPVMILDQHHDVLVTPIDQMSVDMQIYHPVSTYQKGRPAWLPNNGGQLYDLPRKFKNYAGCLLQVFKAGEAPDAVPVDQFIIDTDKAMVLKEGRYIIRLTDREGSLVGTAELSIKHK